MSASAVRDRSGRFARTPALSLVASLWDLPGETSPALPDQSVTCDPCRAVFTDPEAVSFADLKDRAREHGWAMDGPWLVCRDCRPRWHTDAPDGVVARITSEMAVLDDPGKAREAAHQAMLVHDEAPPAAGMWACPVCGGTYDAEMPHPCVPAQPQSAARRLARRLPSWVPGAQPTTSNVTIIPASGDSGWLRDIQAELGQPEDVPGPAAPPPGGPGTHEPRQEDEALDKAPPLDVGHWEKPGSEKKDGPS